jgi:hypothetical protein
MSLATDNLLAALDHAMAVRPRIGGFPVIAEVLRHAGVSRNEWFLPAATSLYETTLGTVVQQGEPLVTDPPARSRYVGRHERESIRPAVSCRPRDPTRVRKSAGRSARARARCGDRESIETDASDEHALLRV